jgi:hypothetical protein
LQGERRWASLAALYLSMGTARIVVGGLGMLVRHTELWATIGVAGGTLVPVVVGYVALRRPRHGQSAARRSGEHSVRALWWETVYNSQALLAFLVLSNVDLIIARNTLESQRAGLYAAGLIMAKAVLFLPQFVVVLAFPSMGSNGAPRRVLVASVLVVAAIGACVIGGVRVLSSLALAFVGGDEYAGIEDTLWLFAVLGTLLAMLQLLVYSVMARQARSSILLLWAGLVVLVVACLGADSVTSLAARVVTVDAVLFAALFAITLWRLRATARAAGQAAEQRPI